MSRQREKLLILTIMALVIASIAFLSYRMLMKMRSRNEAPMITCASDELRVSVKATSEDLLTGVTAMDAEDGDITSSVMVGSISSFYEKGKCEITYVVFDSGNKSATMKRTLYYTDYHSPRFSLTDDLIFQTGEAVAPLKSFSAYDCIDGNITNRISMTWLDTEAAARAAEFRVINSYGDVSSIIVNISTQEKSSQSTPVIKLKSYLEYIEPGEMINPLDYIVSITVGRNVYSVGEYGTDNIYYDMSQFDGSVPGVYRIGIYCENAEHIGETELLVVVED